MPEPQKALISRPYRNFLTPALHRRFTHAALFTLILCYIEAIWMGEWSRELPIPSFDAKANAFSTSNVLSPNQDPLNLHIQSGSLCSTGWKSS